MKSMIVSYINERSEEVHGTAFKQYAYSINGKKDPAISIPRPRGGRSFVTESEYDRVEETYKTLSEKHRLVLADMVARATGRKTAGEPLIDTAFKHLGPDAEVQKASFIDTIRDKGLSSKENAYIIDDLANGKKALRNKPVYRVGDYPVCQDCMEPKVVTFYMAGNTLPGKDAAATKRIFEALGSQDALARGVQKKSDIVSADMPVVTGPAIAFQQAKRLQLGAKL